MPITKLRRVYVPNKGSHDYTAAWDFGDLVFCTDGRVNRRDLNTMYAELSKAFEDADEGDYILLTSLSSLCAIACSIFVNKFGRLNLLIFEGGEYIERFLTFDN
jgi:hypothetical protein